NQPLSPLADIPRWATNVQILVAPAHLINRAQHLPIFGNRNPFAESTRPGNYSIPSPTPSLHQSLPLSDTPRWATDVQISVPFAHLDIERDVPFVEHRN